MLAIQLLPDRDCSKCTALQKSEWGCERDAPIPMVLDGEELYRCPRRPILDDPGYFTSVFTAYKAYIRGYLPDGGSFEDQGYRYTVAMPVIENAVDEARSEKERRESRKTKAKGPIR